MSNVISALLGENADPVRPGDERFKNLPNGSKDRYIQVLATKLVIASTGAMLVIVHEAPVEVSALAAEPNPASRSQKEKLQTSFWRWRHVNVVKACD